MKSMRRADRQITSGEEILAILQQAKVCHLAMQTPEGPYLVPLNFGYAVGGQGDAAEGFGQPLTLYFHSASSGRKIETMQQNPNVCFCVDGAHAFAGGEMLTDYTYHYHSVIGRGTVQFITDPEQRMQAMVNMICHQAGMTEAAVRATPMDERWMQPDALCVMALRVESLSAKRHE